LVRKRNLDRENLKHAAAAAVAELATATTTPRTEQLHSHAARVLEITSRLGASVLGTTYRKAWHAHGYGQTCGRPRPRAGDVCITMRKASVPAAGQGAFRRLSVQCIPGPFALRAGEEKEEEEEEGRTRTRQRGRQREPRAAESVLWALW